MPLVEQAIELAASPPDDGHDIGADRLENAAHGLARHPTAVPALDPRHELLGHPGLGRDIGLRMPRWIRIARSDRPSATSFMVQIVGGGAHLRRTHRGDRGRLIYRSGE